MDQVALCDSVDLAVVVVLVASAVFRVPSALVLTRYTSLPSFLASLTLLLPSPTSSVEREQSVSHHKRPNSRTRSLSFSLSSELCSSPERLERLRDPLPKIGRHLREDLELPLDDFGAGDARQVTGDVLWAARYRLRGASVFPLRGKGEGGEWLRRARLTSTNRSLAPASNTFSQSARGCS